MTTVIDALSSRGLSVPPGLLDLFGWHDGTDLSGNVTLDQIHFFPGFYLLSSADAIKNYDAFRCDRRWNTAWLPIFANGGGDFYAVVCDDADDNFGRIVHFRIEESDHPIEFASVEMMLKTLIAAFDLGVIYVDADGYLEMDDLQFAELAASPNTDVPPSPQ